jgi:hypothetical protein
MRLEEAGLALAHMVRKLGTLKKVFVVLKPEGTLLRVRREKVR